MDLPSLAEAVKDHIQSQLATLKTGYTTQAILDLTVDNWLDPSTLLENGPNGIFVCPVTNDYAMEKSDRRGEIKALASEMIIAVILVIPFTEVRQGDVAPWTEVKEILGFRQKMELSIARHDWGKHPIENVLSEPPAETKLGQRKFIGITEYGFNGKSC